MRPSSTLFAVLMVPLLALGGTLWAAWPTPATALPEGPVSLAVVGATVKGEDGYSLARCPADLVLRQGGYRGPLGIAAETAVNNNGWMARAKPGQALAAWAMCGPRSP